MKRAEPTRALPTVFLGLLGAAGALVLAACANTPGSPRAAVTTSTGVTTSTTATTTTTVPLPTHPLASADQAANALIDDWASGNRAGALGVATPSAVSSLFALSYQSGLAIDRGCSDGIPPVTCTFGPPGGANPNLPIYSLSVSETGANTWYVSAAQEQT